MRGKDIVLINCHFITRITPAHAGKSDKPKKVAPKYRDHPRTCGEKFGSVMLTHIQTGITPAHVGKRKLSIPCITTG